MAATKQSVGEGSVILLEILIGDLRVSVWLVSLPHYQSNSPGNVLLSSILERDNSQGDMDGAATR